MIFKKIKYHDFKLTVRNIAQYEFQRMIIINNLPEESISDKSEGKNH